MATRKTIPGQTVTPAAPKTEAELQAEIDARLDAQFGPEETIAEESASKASPAKPVAAKPVETPKAPETASWDALGTKAEYVSPIDDIPESVCTVFDATFKGYYEEITTPRGIILGTHTPKMRSFTAASEDEAAALGQYAVTWALHQPIPVTAMVEQEGNRITFAFMPTTVASKKVGNSRNDIPQVREWAAKNGFTLNDRGRLPFKVYEAYDNRKA